jgi:hypothetical protein
MKSTATNLTIGVLLLTVTHLYGQLNMVPNPSFEYCALEASSLNVPNNFAGHIVTDQNMDTPFIKDDCTKYLLVEKEGDSYALSYAQLSINLLDSIFFKDIKKEDIYIKYAPIYTSFEYQYTLDSIEVRVDPDFASKDHHFNYVEEEEADMIERVKKYPISNLHIFYKNRSRNYCIKAIISDGKVRFTGR